MRRLLSLLKDFAKWDNTGPLPNVKALFMSGCTADIVNKKGVFEQDRLPLARSIAPHLLLKKVRAVLGKQA